MKASKLIEILAHHMNDEAGGDFEVYISNNLSDPPAAIEREPAERCWLFPGLRQIIIGSK